MVSYWRILTCRCLRIVLVASITFSHPQVAIAGVDSLPVLGSSDSIDVYRHRVTEDPKNVVDLARLGHAYLALDSLDQAQRHLLKSIKYGKLPAAYYGLALCYWMQSEHHNQKIMAFRIEPNLKTAIDRDAAFSPAYMALAELYRDSGWTEKLIGFLETYAEQKPGDLNGRYRLALAYIEDGAYARALNLAEGTLRENPGEARWFAVAGQGYAAAGKAEESVQMWRRYVLQLPDSERAFYKNLSYIATKTELEDLSAGPIREEEAFWRRHDLTLISGGAARKAEHYRRVWYAQTFLSDVSKPWDVRGEVYVRYGEPDYRLRSSHPRKPLPHCIYEVPTGPDYPVGVYVRGVLQGEGEDAVNWETWTYCPGILGPKKVTFTFEDEMKNGRWRWPHLPPQADLAWHPGYRYSEIARRIPDHFDVPPGFEPLEFYYTTATFRGDGDSTRTEVYLGVPPSPEPSIEAGRSITRVERAAVLGTPDREVADRVEGEVAFAGTNTVQEGSFFPDLLKLNAHPGGYQLSVQITDEGSGKWGVYMQQIDIPDYREGLAISDVLVAWRITGQSVGEQYMKGDATAGEPVWVVPMPSRSFQHGESPSFYYEIYNLQKNGFGATSYGIDYEVRRYSHPRIGIVGALTTGFEALFSGRKPSFSVSYDRSGNRDWEPVYFELQTDELEPGLNLLTVKVTDQVGNVTVEKEAIFSMDEPK